MKKEKVILTPEQKVERKLQRKETALLGLKQGIVPLLIQFGILVVVILEFLFLIGEGSIFNPNGVLMSGQISVANLEEATNPTWIRFIYMWLAFAGVIALMAWALKLDEENHYVKQYWIALCAGILLWQAVGECSWHFGVTWYDGNFISFPRIESVQGTFIAIVAVGLWLYALKTKKLSWAVSIFVLSFMINWLAHYVILGIAPFWPQSLRYHNPLKWPKIIGILAGLHGTLMLLYKVFFKAKTQKERLVLSTLLYGFIGVLYYGLSTQMV